MNTSKKKVNNNPENHRSAANDANRRRKERVATNDARILKEKILFNAQWDAAIVAHEIWTQEQEMFVKKEKGAAKKEVARKGGMKVRVGLEEFPSLNAALRACDPKQWGEETPFRRSCWTRINRNLKKFGEYADSGYKFELI